jgi:hypothetical protein
MQRMSVRVVAVATVLVASLPMHLAGQEWDGAAGDRSDLAALVVTRDPGGAGHNARLATHGMKSATGSAGARVSAALFLPDGGAPARDGMIAFMLDGEGAAERAGAIAFRWHFAGLDTVVAFPARVQSRRNEVSYAAEVTEQDLLFLATAHALEVALPDGRLLVVDADLRRRLGLLARLSGLSAVQRAELAAFSRALEASMRRTSRD